MVFITGRTRRKLKVKAIFCSFKCREKPFYTTQIETTVNVTRESMARVAWRSWFLSGFAAMVPDDGLICFELFLSVSVMP